MTNRQKKGDDLQVNAGNTGLVIHILGISSSLSIHILRPWYIFFEGT